MRLLLDAGADINARMVTEQGRNPAEGLSQAAQFSVVLRRPSQVPAANAVPHQTALRRLVIRYTHETHECCA